MTKIGPLPEGQLVPVQNPAIGDGALLAQNAEEFVARAGAIASALSRVIDGKGLYTDIRGKKHVWVEGWTTLAAMLGFTPVELSNDRQPDGSYVAKVALVKTSTGQEVAVASAECGSEKDGPWPDRAMYAKRSMAATRATSKACRLAFSWVMVLSGYAPTPAEEMESLEFAAKPNRTSASAAKGGRASHGTSARPPANPVVGKTRLNNVECPDCGGRSRNA